MYFTIVGGCGYVYVKQVIKGEVFFTVEYADGKELKSLSIEEFKKMARY
jgi:predicted Ser/Thr protein kinase